MKNKSRTILITSIAIATMVAIPAISMALPFFNPRVKCYFQICAAKSKTPCRYSDNHGNTYQVQKILTKRACRREGGIDGGRLH